MGIKNKHLSSVVDRQHHYIYNENEIIISCYFKGKYILLLLFLVLLDLNTDFKVSIIVLELFFFTRLLLTDVRFTTPEGVSGILCEQFIAIYYMNRVLFDN